MATNFEGIALLAVAYVKEKLRGGSQTDFFDVISTGGRALWCVERARAQARARGWSSVAEQIEVMAATAEANGCGNCGEQAAVAFMFLKRWPVAPIDFVHLQEKDHDFVVIGATDSNSPYITDWGLEAVICDPWDGKAYPIRHIYDRMYNSGGKVRSMYRIASL
jgi:hypothetical protein